MTAKTTRKPAAAAAAKKATPAKAKPEPKKDQPLTRTQAVALLREKGYTGPVSYDMGTVRSILTWVEAGSPEGDGSIPAGVLHAVHPHLKPAAKSGNSEARTIARDLRKAVTASLTAEGKDQAELLNDVDGLAARLREVLSA